MALCAQRLRTGDSSRSAPLARSSRARVRKIALCRLTAQQGLPRVETLQHRLRRTRLYHESTLYMSQTMTAPAPVQDQYLAQQPAAPGQTFDLEQLQKYGSLRIVTPIGRVAGVTLVKPRAYEGSTDEKFYLRLLLNPASVDGSVETDLLRALYAVVMNRFPVENRMDPATGQMRGYSGWDLLSVPPAQGGLWNPIQDGNLVYYQDPAKYGPYFGTKFINATVGAVNAKSGASQQPVVMDETGKILNPDKIYLGCYARMMITLFAFPKPGAQAKNRGVAMKIDSVQFARHGEKMSTYDSASAAQKAFAGAGAIPVDPTAPSAPGGGGFAAPQGGFAAPQGGGFAAPAGFAAPPAQNGAPGGFAAAPQPQFAPQGAVAPQQFPQAAPAGFGPPGFPPQG